MSDFEERVSESLRAAGGGAPPAAGLADAARGRARVRRRRTALVSVGAVVAVVAVVGGVAAFGGGGRDPQVADTPTTSPTVSDSPAPSGRVESWRDLSITVPVSWGHGPLSTWCAGGGSLDQPRVERPGGMREMILCTPSENGYGLQFLDTSAADLAHQPGEVWQYQPGNVSVYPDGAWLGYQRAGDNAVLVVTPGRGAAEAVLASFQHVTGADPQGCLPKVPYDWPQGGANVDGVRLCRYATDGWLDQSELLTGSDAEQAVAALDAAPAGQYRRCPAAVDRTVVEVTTSDRSGLVNLDACQAITWDGEPKDLTPDVLYWVLSPGWTGQLPEGVTVTELASS